VATDIAHVPHGGCRMVSPPSYSVPTCHCPAERSPLSRTAEAECPATLFETNALEASVEADATSGDMEMWKTIARRCLSRRGTLYVQFVYGHCKRKKKSNTLLVLFVVSYNPSKYSHEEPSAPRPSETTGGPHRPIQMAFLILTVHSLSVFFFHTR
jgi:hypothetical protein